MRFFWDKYPAPMRQAFDACLPNFRGAAGFSALINLLYLAPTIYMMQVYDRVVPSGGQLTLLWLTLVLGAALATMAALENVRSRLMMQASLRLNRELSGRIMTRLVESDRDASAGQAMREFDVLRQTMTGPALTALFDTPWTPIYFVTAFLIHPLLGLMIVVAGAILVTLAYLNEKSSRAHAKTASSANAQAYGAQDALSRNSELIRSQGMRKAMVSLQQRGRSEGLIAATDAQLLGMRYNSIIKFVRMFMQSLALGAGAILAINGMISSGTIIAASVLLSRALQPIEQLVGSWSAIVQSRHALASLTDLFAGADEQPKTYHPLPEPSGKLAAIGLTVRNASEDAFILRSVSFEIAPGEVVGVIGHSGAGKSTLARILAGAIAPHVGELRIDGGSYADWDPDLLARHVGYMPQRSEFLPGTIAENISRYAATQGEDADAVAHKVIEAAKLAHVHELIQMLPGGYAARFGDAGFGLSGGQLQRIALARALYGDPKVLVLDEPGSALDSEGEMALQWAIRAAKSRGAAVVLVTHQPAMLNQTDRLFVMRGGALELQGPTQQVIATLRQDASRSNVRDINREEARNG